MLLISLLFIPLIGIFIISTITYNSEDKSSLTTLKQIKVIALSTSIINLFISLIVFNRSSVLFKYI